MKGLKFYSCETHNKLETITYLKTCQHLIKHFLHDGLDLFRGQLSQEVSLFLSDLGFPLRLTFSLGWLTKGRLTTRLNLKQQMTWIEKQNKIKLFLYFRYSRWLMILINVSWHLNHCTLTRMLNHWGRVMHICVSNLTVIGSDNGLTPGRRQAIIWTNDGILLIQPSGTNFSEILNEIQTFSFKKTYLNVLSAKWRPFCLGLNVLTLIAAVIFRHLSKLMSQVLTTPCYQQPWYWSLTLNMLGPS